MTLYDAHGAARRRNAAASTDPAIDEQRLRAVTTPQLGKPALRFVAIAPHALECDRAQGSRVP